MSVVGSATSAKSSSVTDAQIADPVTQYPMKQPSQPETLGSGHSVERCATKPAGWEATAPANQPSVANGTEVQEVSRQARKEAATTFRQALEGKLGDLAERYPTAGDRPRTNELLHGPFGQSFLTGDVADAVSLLPRETARTIIENLVNKTWPGISAEAREALCSKLMSVADQQLQNHSMFAVRDTAVKAMTSAAEGLRKLARDPEALAELASTLQRMEGPGADADMKEKAHELRCRLGLGAADKGQDLSPANLAKLIEARANLTEEQGHELARTGANRVAKELLGMSAGEAFLRSAGIEKGSWAEQQVGAVEAQGKADKKLLAAVESATTLALAVAVPGLGVAIEVALTGMTAAELSREVDKMGAAESAGLADAGAQDQAQRALRSELALGVVKVVLGHGAGKLVHKVAHLAEKKIGAAAAEALKSSWAQERMHSLAHWATGEGVKKAHHALAAEHAAGAPSLTGAQQATLSMGAANLMSRPSAQEALEQSMAKLGLDTTDARKAALQSFLAARGSTVSKMDDAGLVRAFEQFVRSSKAKQAQA